MQCSDMRGAGQSRCFPLHRLRKDRGTMEEEGIGRTARNNFATVALLFCGAIIVWVVLYGKPDNSLHASALARSFTVFGGVLAAIGFGAISTLILPYTQRKL